MNLSKAGKLFLLVLICFILGIGTAGAEDITIERINGGDEIGTSIEVSKQGWDSAQTVIIARVDEFPDTLAGTVLAHKENAPILLTRPDRLNFNLQLEIMRLVRLGAEKAIILGGEAAVGKTVEEKLETLGLSTVRIGGENRYETSALIADYVGVQEKAVLAYGENFPDALAIAPYASVNGYPILLTSKDNTPDVVEKRLKGVDETIVVGGTAVISDDVVKSLPGASRIAGVDRYETAVKIAENSRMSGEGIYLATGLDFQYALVGSLLAAKDNSPMILTRGNSISSRTVDLIKRNDTFKLIGGITITIELKNLFGSELVLSGGELSSEDVQRLRNYDIPSSSSNILFDDILEDGAGDGLIDVDYKRIAVDSVEVVRSDINEYYSNADAKYLTDVRLAFRHNGIWIRGVLQITFHGPNEYDLEPGQTYEADAQAAVINPVGEEMQLQRVNLLSDFKKVD